MASCLNADLAIDTTDLTHHLANFGSWCDAVTRPPHGGPHVIHSAQLAGVAVVGYGFAADNSSAVWMGDRGDEGHTQHRSVSGATEGDQ